MRLFFLGTLFLLNAALLSAQCPQPIFTAPNQVCRDEELVLTNGTAGAVEFEWDFCTGDLTQVPVLDGAAIAPGSIAGPSQTTFVQDNGNWYGFVVSRFGSRNITRLDFGNSLANTPQAVNLGSFGGAFNQPIDIEFRKENGIWYALLIDLGASLVYRFTFDSIDDLTPSVTPLTSLNQLSLLDFPVDITLLEGDVIKALITNFNGKKITEVNFGASINTESVMGSNISIPSGTDFQGIASTQVCDVWYALATSTGSNKIFQLKYQNGLSSSPMVTEVVGNLNIANPVGITMGIDGTESYSFIMGADGNVFRMNDVSNAEPLITSLGNLSSQSSGNQAIKLLRDKSDWFGFLANINVNSLTKIKFHQPCSVNAATSNLKEPVGIAYSTAGFYEITLTAKLASGYTSALSKLVTVSGNQSPTLKLTSQSIRCIEAGNQFKELNTNPDDVAFYVWDFGDGTIESGTETIEHFYQAEDSYTVDLTVTLLNGCTNRISTEVSVFNAPQNNFSLPSLSSQACSLQSYSFENTSLFSPQSQPAWSWFVDNIKQGDQSDFSFLFDDPGTYAITLQSEVSGCVNQSTKNFTVSGTGTLVDFSINGQCPGVPISFTNNTNGLANGFSWNFGDGITSNQFSPSHIYAVADSYSVTLQATNASGCTNSKTKTVLITSAPTPDFYIDLPPFSCSGSPTQFYDATPPPPDGNIVSWNWDFGDGGATSIQQNPQHTYALAGTYLVTLQTETNFGCQATTQIPIEISQSLTADFSVGPACLQKGTQFQSLAMANVLSWRWSINNSFYTFPDPTHTFSSPGTYPATLIVVGTNGCEGLATKNITINPAPLLDFSTSAVCANAETIFSDMSSGVDLPTSWRWVSNGLELATGSPTVITFPSSGLMPIRMIATTQAGCEYSLIKNVVISPSPSASFTASATFGAPPLQVQFNNTSVNASSYSWNFGKGNATSTAEHPTFVFNDTGDYLVELIASNGAGCSDAFSQIISALVPAYDLTLENLEITEGISSPSKIPLVTIKNNSNVWVAATDVWITGGNGLRLKSRVELNLAPNASTEVEVPIEIFSNEEFLCVELDVVGDVNRSDNSSCQNLVDKPVLLAPYPNPTSGTLWFDVVLSAPQMGTLKIADSMGKTVYDEQFSALNSGMNRIQIDFKSLAPGTYLAIWEVAGKKSTFRFLAF